MPDLCIAFNASLLSAPRTGIGQYIAGLVGALHAQPEIKLRLFLGGQWHDQLPAADTAHSMRTSRLNALLRPLPGAYPLRRFFAQRAFQRHLADQHCDLYHEPTLWPLAAPLPLVMTLHDLSHLRYPHTHPAGRRREIERHLEPAVRRAARILVDSDFIGREVQAHFSLPAEKIVVAPLGCGREFHPRPAEQTQATLAALGLNHGRYLLCVGTLEPRKNLALALRAHARLPAALRTRYPLLIVGLYGWGKDPFAGELQTALASGQVRLTGYLDRLRLAELVAGARALIYPSLYEGFGLPVLEAMASGIPVIVSDRASLPEVAGSAGITVDAADETGLSIALQRLIEDEAEWQHRRHAGLQQAATFSWQRCAAQTVAAYRAALATRTTRTG
ncbi:MAG: glycosyltransferase family 4 protein [Sterolibacterium sp.]|nr:glycosyltransferase family 4 protein [Sterolibacterium sp.]